MAASVYSLCWSSVLDIVSPQERAKSCFSYRSHRYKPCWLSELGVLIAEVLNVGVLDVGLNSLSLGESRSCEFFHNCIMLCEEWSLWWECVSAFPTCFSGYFLIHCCIRAFWRELLLCVVVDLASPWQKRNSRTSLYCNLDQNLFNFIIETSFRRCQSY